MDICILIPARLNSSRFPGKMLADLDGLPLIRRVYDRCAEVYPTHVLTDSEEIANVVPDAIMTGEHDSGTDRCMAVIPKLPHKRFILCQGDMPDITPDILHALSYKLHRSAIATCYTKAPASVKCIHNGAQAQWFTRAPISYGDSHIGVYGFQRCAADVWRRLKPHEPEQFEKLEQLRWLSNGIAMDVVPVDYQGVEINWPHEVTEWLLKSGAV